MEGNPNTTSTSGKHIVSIYNTMRARYKGPAGTGIIEMPDSATVQDVLDELRARTGIVSFTIKYGPPMAMKTLDLGQVGETARSIGLHGETLTIVPEEAPPAPDTTTQAASQPSEGPEDINVPWPGREGTLCDYLNSVNPEMTSLTPKLGPKSHQLWRGKAGSMRLGLFGDPLRPGGLQLL
ncbi:hypothetical protein AUP68_16086 [Ilyonectria robusta]